jgi:thiol:disulfide interchange protein DsbD
VAGAASHPRRPAGELGYEAVLLLTALRASPTSEIRLDRLTARADWLVCKEICIPEGVDLVLDLPVRAEAAADPKWSGAIASARAQLPGPLPGWQASAQANGSQIALKLVAPPGYQGDPGTLHFFAHDEGASSRAPQARRATAPRYADAAGGEHADRRVHAGGRGVTAANDPAAARAR